MYLGFATILLLIASVAEAENAVIADLVNTKVQRTIDLSTHLPKISTILTIENTGKSAVDYMLYAVDKELESHQSFIGAVVKSGDEESTRLLVTKTDVSAHKDIPFYRIKFPKALEAGKSLTLEVETVYGHTLQPFPAQITQSEKQYVKFVGNVYYYSPYKTTSQATSVVCASSTIDHYTKEKPTTISEKTINYGPYENVEPFKSLEMVIHYENNTPFLTITSMSRVIEVSHWGNIAVEETYDLVHSGAILKGPFSRYDYQRHQDGVSSVKLFRTLLPPSANNVYYRDEIGNISTSHLRETDEGMELEIRPRFPLFGGWKTHYYIGYSIPSYQYLYRKDSDYALKMKFVDHVFDDQMIDHLMVKIILPEGSKNLKIKTPYTVKREPDEVHYTYLDTVGRPVMVLSKDNLVEQHIQDFELRYKFPRYMMLQEPLLIIGSFYLLFLLVIIYVRLDFAISKDEASEAKMRLESLIEQVQAVQDKRSALYQMYDDAINKFKASKDSSSFMASRKKHDANHKQLTQQIAALQAKLKSEGSDASEKINELQRLDGLVNDQIKLAIQYAEQLVAGRINKQKYLDSEAAMRTKKDELCQKMEQLLQSL